MEDVNVILSCKEAIEKNQIKLSQKKKDIRKFCYALGLIFILSSSINWLANAGNLSQQFIFTSALFVLAILILSVYLLFSYRKIFKLKKQRKNWHTTIRTLQNISKYRTFQQLP